jgi:anti-anti-sigma factor
MLTLGSELLVHQVAEFKPQLLQALDALPEGADLVLGCADLADVDGAGLQMLVVLAMTLQQRDGALRLAGCSNDLRRRIAATALDGWFVFETLEAA